MHALTVERYDFVAVTPGFVYCDLINCEDCAAPIPFPLPYGYVKRTQDRHSGLPVGTVKDRAVSQSIDVVDGAFDVIDSFR